MVEHVRRNSDGGMEAAMIEQLRPRSGPASLLKIRAEYTHLLCKGKYHSKSWPAWPEKSRQMSI